MSERGQRVLIGGAMAPSLRGRLRVARLNATLAIALSIAVTGCVFLVDSLPDNISTTCHLSGGACGTCIAANCQTKIDACCGDDACKPVLANADFCAQYSECSSLGTANSPGKIGDLVSCIASSCTALCHDIDGGNDASSSSCPTCKTRCASANSASCACSAPTTAAPANNVDCSTSTIDNAICCATPDWPAFAGGSCSCQSLFCYDDSGSGGVCSCQFGTVTIGATSVDSCSPITSSSCCLTTTTGFCTCDPNDACDQTNEVSVSECSSTTISCPSGSSATQTTSSCSVQ